MGTKGGDRVSAMTLCPSSQRCEHEAEKHMTDPYISQLRAHLQTVVDDVRMIDDIIEDRVCDLHALLAQRAELIAQKNNAMVVLTALEKRSACSKSMISGKRSA